MNTALLFLPGLVICGNALLFLTTVLERLIAVPGNRSPRWPSARTVRPALVAADHPPSRLARA